MIPVSDAGRATDLRRIADVVSLGSAYISHGLIPMTEKTGKMPLSAVSGALLVLTAEHRRLLAMADKAEAEAEETIDNDKEGALRLDDAMEGVRFLLDCIFEASEHIEADVSDFKAELVHAYAHLDDARHKLAAITGGGSIA